MSEAIEVCHLSAVRQKREILHDVTLTIGAGRMVSIVGPNGCGKSTLLKTLSRMIPISAGTVRILGRDIHSFGRKELARHVAVLPQVHPLPEDMTVRELAALGRFPYRSLYRPASREDAVYIDKALHAVHLEEEGDTLLQHLSGGEQQRAWLAMLLAQRSPVLLLDEPATYLDIRHQLHMMKLLQHINEKLGLTIVIVLHDMNQALRYTQQTVVMNQGRIVCAGPSQHVLTPERIQQVFGVRTERVTTADGQQALIPIDIE